MICRYSEVPPYGCIDGEAPRLLAEERSPLCEDAFDDDLDFDNEDLADVKCNRGPEPDAIESVLKGEEEMLVLNSVKLAEAKSLDDFNVFCGSWGSDALLGLPCP